VKEKAGSCANGLLTDLAQAKSGMHQLSVTATPRNRAGALALEIYARVLNSVRADHLVQQALRLEDGVLRAGDRSIPLANVHRIFVVGAGKAAAAMAAGVERVLGDRIAGGLVVTKYGHRVETRHVRVVEAAHPIPDEASLAAGAAIMDIAQNAGAEDLLICLISGGASALMELPVEGVALQDLQTVTDLLLRSGAAIQEVNRVRASLSRIKAGGLARAAAPARVLCLAVSDVLGNPPGAIGSGPCVPQTKGGESAWAVLQRYGLARDVPENVRRALDAPCSASEPHPYVDFQVIGDIGLALDVACGCAEELGLNPLLLTRWMQGEAKEIGTLMGAIARDLPQAANRSGVHCLVLGGEPTVTVRGAGRGGRAQELALAAALAMGEEPRTVALLAAGTDGTDGPTDAAGALVDGSTVGRVKAAGGDPVSMLNNNDSYTALDSAGALVVTGPTQSNVNDLVILVHAEEE